MWCCKKYFKLDDKQIELYCKDNKLYIILNCPHCNKETIRTIDIEDNSIKQVYQLSTEKPEEIKKLKLLNYINFLQYIINKRV